MSDFETDLMLRTKNGDRAAFEELYSLYQKPLLNYLYRICWNRALAEDLLQETFLRLWRAAPGYQPVAKVSTYLFRIAHNLSLNEAARHGGKTWKGVEKEATQEDFDRQEVDNAVRKAVETLPPGERACLMLSEYSGFKYSEIAEILEIPVGTVKSRMFNAVQRLKETLKDLR